jgi:chromosome segregation ATPase
MSKSVVFLGFQLESNTILPVNVSTSCTSEVTSTDADKTKDETASGTRWSDAEPEHTEVERKCNEKANARSGLRGKKDEHSAKVRRFRKELQGHTSLELPEHPAKRSRISSVDAGCDRYRELRDKNNEAARKSRQKRKARESEMNERMAKLEAENESLKKRAEEMERHANKQSEQLFKVMMEQKHCKCKT